MKPVPFNKAIELANANSFIIEELKVQVEKDLSMDAYSWSVNDSERDFDTIFKALESYLDFLLQKRREQVPQMLYRVDLDEKVLLENLQSGKYPTEAKMLAEMILERELKKVIIRNLLKGRLKL